MSLESLRANFPGDVVLPRDDDYDQARRVWNATADRRPAVVLRPRDEGAVAAAIRVARDLDLPLAVRCGGHSIAGYSTCDDGIVLDLSMLRGVTVDPSRRVATVRGGSLLGDLDRAARDHGLFCPVGVVSHTGVGGLTLGGGMGRMQRKYGLTIDNLLAVTLVTADGRTVRASAEGEPDLFWALRGAGANFGVATSFEFRLHPHDGAVTHGMVAHPIERAHDLAAVFRDLAENGPAELMPTYAVGVQDGRPVAFVVVRHCGSAERAERDLAPLRAFGTPVSDTIARVPYLTAQGVDDVAMQWGRRFYMKSGFLPKLPDAVIDLFVDHLDRRPPGGDSSLGLWSWGGAIADVPEDAMAFTGRDAAFWVGVESVWESAADDAVHRDWARAALADLGPFLGTGRYVNDASDPDEAAAAAVYGPAKHERLRTLKRLWDPDNVFRLNQNIRP